MIEACVRGEMCLKLRGLRTTLFTVTNLVFMPIYRYERDGELAGQSTGGSLHICCVICSNGSNSRSPTKSNWRTK